MMPFLEEEVVNTRGWLSAEEFVDFVAISESTPGPFAVNISTYVGSQMGGFFGAVCSTLGLVLPSFVIIILIARFYEKFRTSNLVKGAMTGLKPVSIGLVTAAVISIGSVVFFPNGFSFGTVLTYNFITSLGICILMTVLCFKKLHPIFIILISGVLGIGFGYLGKLLPT